MVNVNLLRVLAREIKKKEKSVCVFVFNQLSNLREFIRL